MHIEDLWMKINLFPWKNSKIVACPKCKWIGNYKNLSTVKYNVYNGSNPISREEDVPCCPKCGRAMGLLSPKYMGIFKFIYVYFKHEDHA